VKEISDVLNACNPYRFIDLSVRAVTLSSMNPSIHWNRGRVVLLGDSAHAMAPFLGQGANQAILDSFRIALAVNNVNNKIHSSSEQETAIFDEMRMYENDRRLKTLLLGSKSGILGALETLGSPAGMFFRDSLFRLLGKAGVVDYVFSDGASPDVY
jgi:salicylate hydroxylase